MKKLYAKPMIEIESYVLSNAIAANCGSVISLGPEAPGKTTCSEFKGSFEVYSINPNARTSGGTPFYADGAAHCDCYYSSGDSVYFTS